MDSQPPEGESTNPELHIKLNEKFNPFPENNKAPHSLNYVTGVEQYVPLREHVLELPGGIQFPIRLSATASRSRRCFALTPFSDNGYTITSDDYDAEKRLAKINLPENQLEIDFLKDPLSVGADAASFILEKKGIVDKIGTGHWKFKEKFAQILQHLQYVIHLPNGYIVKSDIDESSFRQGSIRFGNFYPIDLGPLAMNYTLYDAVVRKGLHLHLPLDFDKLAQIRAQFIMGKEPEEKIEPPEKKPPKPPWKPLM